MKRIGEAILVADRVTLTFGGITALNGISIAIRRHEILAMIGPNGAGKTSMLNVFNGFYRPQDGTITWKGETRRHMRPYHAAAQGIARTFQNVALFKGMTTLDNIMTGRLLRMRRNFLWQAIHLGPAEREELQHRAHAERIIDFLEIQAIRKTPVGRLPYGLQKRVELGRALAMEPELLLLDEPMAGMNVEEKEDMCRFILDVNDEFGTTIALIEHDMGVVMDISDRVVVLDYGRKIADGPPDEVRIRPEVIAAYLGEAHVEALHPPIASAIGGVKGIAPMDFVSAVFLTPFANMADNLEFVLEVVIGGLLSGVMYSLVALGFVLIFKASGVFNFAQGTMVLFAALTFVGMIERGLPIWGAFAVAAAVMVLLAAAVERLMLRPLVNQEPIILFMATIGLAFFLDGFGQLVWGADVHPLDIGIPKAPLIIGGVLVNEFDLVAAAVAGSLVAALVLFQRTAIGRALRAVADDHQAAQSVGIPLRSIWVIVWAIAGVVGLVAGIMWGSNLGVQFSISLVALKALPVLMLGGFTSVPGAIVGGLIVGVGEKLAEVFWGPAFGGAIEDWFAYALALVFLLFRPQGLFGERIIERV